MIVAAEYGTIGDIEIAWVLIAACGFGFALHNYIDAAKDCRALTIQGIYNGRMLLARAQKWQDGIRMCIHSIFMIIGMLAMFIPDNMVVDTSEPAFWIGIAVRWGLLIGAALLVAQSTIARLVRFRVMELARAEYVLRAAAEKEGGTLQEARGVAEKKLRDDNA